MTKVNYEQRILSVLAQGETEQVAIPDLSEGIYIYGAGDFGCLALEYCEACSIRIIGFLDCSRTSVVVSKSGKKYPVHHTGFDFDMSALEKPIAVAVSTAPYTPIKQKLAQSGWKSVVPFYTLTAVLREGHPLANGWRVGKVSRAERDSVITLCNTFEDDISRAHYESFLAWHTNCTETTLGAAEIDPSQRYAIPQLLTELRSRSTQMIDIGSHIAESTARLNTAEIFFNEYVYFEPDSRSRHLLSQRLSDLLTEGARFRIYPDVLGEGIETKPFVEGLGYCSQIWSRGRERRETQTLDSYHLAPDFIKVHTEGSEFNILSGARETIYRSKPVIAYAVYHRRQGFHSDITGSISLFPGYRWYFRLHGFQGSGAFVYGIPS